MDAIRDTDAPIEALQIRAAAEEHVLAVVDGLADAWMPVGKSPPAQVGTPLDQLHAEAGLSQSAGRAHPRYAAADDRNGLPQIVLQSSQNNPLFAEYYKKMLKSGFSIQKKPLGSSNSGNFSLLIRPPSIEMESKSSRRSFDSPPPN
jgi:hypothetical protein